MLLSVYRALPILVTSKHVAKLLFLKLNEEVRESLFECHHDKYFIPSSEDPGFSGVLAGRACAE